MPPERPKVLIVDDNDELLASVELALRRRGLEVVATSSAIGVSALVRRHEPAVVVLDVMMPALDGGTLAKLIQLHLRGQQKTPAIIFFSAMAEEQLYKLTQTIEGTTYVPKVDGVDALYAAICRTMALSGA
jgi:CheY-like chemotaxis protein